MSVSERGVGLYAREVQQGFIPRDRLIGLIDRRKNRVVALVEGGLAPGEFSFIVLRRAECSAGAVAFYGIGVDSNGYIDSARWRWLKLNDVPTGVLAKGDARRLVHRRLITFPESLHGSLCSSRAKLVEMRAALGDVRPIPTPHHQDHIQVAHT